MSTRIRILTVPPLSPTKVWLSLGNLPPAATVNDLKRSLCERIPVLKALRSDQIQLFVEDFELLGASAIGIVRENDMVHVKHIGSCIPTPVLRKRKRSDSAVSSSSSSSSSSSTSSPSESSPSSSSDSESTIDPASDSGAPLSKPKVSNSNERQLADQRPFVSPGMGKPATHSRNIRRRRKLQHERTAVNCDPGDPSVGVNAIPLGNCSTTGVPGTTTKTTAGAHEEFMMSSLSNKNKRRGFKNKVGKEVPSKIIFSEQVNPKTSQDGVVQAFTPRLVPPSEKQEKGLLPPNVFVTSVDVEEGLRLGKKSKSVTLGANLPDTLPVAHSTGGIDRTAIESKWDSLGLVSSVTELPTGTIVGWKALGINPVTITPEVMLQVGTVVSCNESQVMVRYSDWTGVRLGSEEDAEEIEESYGWGDIVGQWRTVSF